LILKLILPWCHFWLWFHTPDATKHIDPATPSWYWYWN
jgi:hypothetical protein